MKKCAYLAPLLLALSISACGHAAAKLSTIKVAGKEVADAGQIHVEREGQPVPGSAAMELEPGDSVRTGADTTLVLRFGEARAILMPNTKVTLGSIFAWFGRVFVSGWLQGKSEVVSAAVKGTQYVIEVDEQSGLTTISVLEGSVHVNSAKQRFPPIELTSAQRVRVPADLAQPPAIEPIGHGEFNTLIDLANAARDPALDQLLLPDVTGVRAQEAAALLSRLGFQVTRSEVVVPSADAVGLVAGQVPRAGSATRRVELQVGRLFKAGFDKVQIKTTGKLDAGSPLALTWIGPNHEDDKIVLVPADLPATQYVEGLTLSARAGQGELRAPAEAGRYELRYLSTEASGAVLARAPLEVAPVRASLRVPSVVAAGTLIELEWQGPNRKDDRVYFVAAGTPDGTRLEGSDATISAEGGKGSLRAPSQPGDYEFRYELAGSSKNAVILARAKLSVTAVEARLVAPASCEAGANFELSWMGPNAADDRILLVPAGQADHQYFYFPEWTISAGPGRGAMRAPTEPGEYELRYALSGVGAALQGDRRYAVFSVVARVKISVTPATATVQTVRSAEAGSTIRVSWQGPNRSDDWLLIAPADSPPTKNWERSWTLGAHTGSGELRVPAFPGMYEVRYILGGVALRELFVAGRARFEVTPAKAVITAPASIRAGAELNLSWSGPKRSDDEIFFVPAGWSDSQWSPDSVRSAEKGRGSMKAPTRPGDYELRYKLAGAFGGPAIIARKKLRVVP